MIQIVVVDDDPMQLELVDRALSRDGFEVTGALSIDALATEARGLDPQLVLIDVNMPDVEPEDVIATVRRLTATARIVLYSAWDESKLRALALRLGADAYVSKSESVFSLGQRLRTICGGASHDQK